MKWPIPLDNAAKFHQVLRAQRRAQEISQRELAARLFVPNVAVCRWEIGRRQITLTEAIRLADALGYDLALIPREDEA